MLLHMNKKYEVGELQSRLTLELRRGALALAILSQVDTPQYGYSLLQTLAEDGLEIDQGTLYPLLRRLEEQGLLSSSWDLEGRRPRKYYVLSDSGVELLESLSTEWRRLVDVMDVLLIRSEGGL